MSKRNNDRERRKQQRLERLGTNNPRCPGCGETRWYCFDAHHIAGRRYDDTIVSLCLNCHAEQSEFQKDHPATISSPPDPLERIGHFLLGVADLLETLIRKLREFGHQLIEEARKAVAPPLKRDKDEPAKD